MPAFDPDNIYGSVMDSVENALKDGFANINPLTLSIGSRNVSVDRAPAGEQTNISVHSVPAVAISSRQTNFRPAGVIREFEHDLEVRLFSVAVAAHPPDSEADAFKVHHETVKIILDNYTRADLDGLLDSDKVELIINLQAVSPEPNIGYDNQAAYVGFSIGFRITEEF